MNALTWDRTLSVQVDEIDQDHRRLVELFNLLRDAVADRESADYIAALLDELISCTVWHFKHEERLMLRYGYHRLAEHRAEHDELIDSARRLQQQFLHENRPLADDQIKFLEHWLTGHILDADMKLGAYLCMAM